MSFIDKTKILYSLPAKDLKQICKENQIKGYSSLNKSKLIDLIVNSISEDSLENILKDKGLIPDEIISDEEILKSMNTSRKLDDKKYLNYLLLSLNVKELKELCKEYYLEDCSRYAKVDLIKHILDSLSEEEYRRILYEKEIEIISKEIDVALKKINGKDRESIEGIKITNPDTHEIEIHFKGWNWESTSFLSINNENIDDPERDCDCRVGTNNGLCNHFWVGFIYSLKLNYFKLSDWNLTKLPENFEEQIKSIKLTSTDTGEPSKIALIDESSESVQLKMHLSSRITVYEGEITKIVERQSEFQEHITIYFIVILKDVKLGPQLKKASDYNEDDILDVDDLKLRVSDSAYNKSGIKEGDKISCNGGLNMDNYWGFILKRVSKLAKIK